VHPHRWKDYGGRGQIPASFAKSSPSSFSFVPPPQVASLIIIEDAAGGLSHSTNSLEFEWQSNLPSAIKPDPWRG
jgi:hypothetical protein